MVSEILNIDNAVSESIYLRELHHANVYPVFVIFKHTDDDMLHATIRKFTKSYWGHAAIAFDPSLKSMYSFLISADGFGRESIVTYGDKSTVKVMCCLVDLPTYQKMRASVTDFARKKKKTSYGFKHFIAALTKVPMQGNLAMVCSNFVDYILKVGDISPTKMDFSVIHPGRLSRAFNAKKEKKFFTIYQGPSNQYNPDQTFRVIKVRSGVLTTESNIPSTHDEMSIICENLFDDEYKPYTEAYIMGNDMEPTMESLLNKDDVYYRFDDWVNGKENVLFITGLSGSGKSTLATKIAKKYHAKYIEIDVEGKKIEREHHEIEHLSSKNARKQRILELIVSKYGNEKVVIEGYQIGTFCDPDYVKQHAIIIIGVGTLLADWRITKRALTDIDRERKFADTDNRLLLLLHAITVGLPKNIKANLHADSRITDFRANFEYFEPSMEAYFDTHTKIPYKCETKNCYRTLQGPTKNPIPNLILHKDNHTWRVRSEILLFKGDKLLLVKTGKMNQYGVTYIIPGGGIDTPSEYIEVAAARECKEEAHITPKNVRYTGITSSKLYKITPWWHKDVLWPDGIKYDGYMTFICTGEYDGEYKGYVKVMDRQSDFKNQKFYSYDECKDILSKEHKELFEKYLITNLNKTLTDYRWGLVTPSGKIIDDPESTHWVNDYKILTPDKFEKHKAGCCWDYCVYQKKWFEKNFPKYKLTFWYIEDEDMHTHTTMTYEIPGDNTVYWFEGSWKPNAGIKEFSSEKEFMNKFIDLFMEGRKFYILMKYEPIEGLSCEEFMTYVIKNGKISHIDSESEPNYYYKFSSDFNHSKSIDPNKLQRFIEIEDILLSKKSAGLNKAELDELKMISKSVTAPSVESFVPTMESNKPFYFYHLVPKGSDVRKMGLISPQYMYDHKMYDMFDKSVEKYRSRISGPFKLSTKKPEELTREDIINAMNTFRKGKDGMNQIYLFRYAPHKGLGKNMHETLAGKDVYRIDLNDPRVKKYIKEIDWGWEGSNTDNKKLSRRYYEKVTPDEYFKNYDDNAKMTFAAMNHISVIPTKGYLPYDILEKVDESYKPAQEVGLAIAAGAIAKYYMGDKLAIDKAKVRTYIKDHMKDPSTAYRKALTKKAVDVAKTELKKIIREEAQQYPHYTLYQCFTPEIDIQNYEGFITGTYKYYYPIYYNLRKGHVDINRAKKVLAELERRYRSHDGEFGDIVIRINSAHDKMDGFIEIRSNKWRYNPALDSYFYAVYESPEDLLAVMKTFDWGWYVDKDHTTAVGEADWLNKIRTTTSEQLIERKIGSCWDYAIFIQEWFQINHPEIEIKRWYMEGGTGGESHAWVSYYLPDDHRTYVIEVAFKGEERISTFESDEDMIRHYVSFIPKYWDRQDRCTVFNVTEDFPPQCSPKEFISFCIQHGNKVANINNYYDDVVKPLMRSKYTDWTSYHFSGDNSINKNTEPTGVSLPFAPYKFAFEKKQPKVQVPKDTDNSYMNSVLNVLRNE